MKTVLLPSLLSLLLLAGWSPGCEIGESTEAAAGFATKTIPDLVFAKPGGVELLLDLHLPEGVENPPLVMFMHWGGWRIGTRKNFRLGWLVERGYAVASIEYRMSREAVFPAQIHDCKGALRWLRAHADKHGYNADKVAVCGMSAGGYLAALMGSTSGMKEFEGNTAGHLDQSSKVQGVIDYSGPTDFILRSTSQPQHTENPKGVVHRLLDGAVTKNPEKAALASPVTHVDANDPPFLIIHGDQDPQVLPAQSKRLFEVCQEKKVEAQLLMIEGKKHLWTPPTDNEQKTILEFLKRTLGAEH